VCLQAPIYSNVRTRPTQQLYSLHQAVYPYLRIVPKRFMEYLPVLLRSVKELVKNTPFEGAARSVYKPLRALYIWVSSSQENRAIRYDKETLAVMERVLRKNSNCVDVGSHTGSILKEMLRFAPDGVHYAFEPLHSFCQQLVNSCPSSTYPNVHMYEIALSDRAGQSSFQYVVTDPAYSGLRRRSYEQDKVHIEQIEVKTDLLDNIIAPELPIHFIKIDVEGAELQVLKGALGTIRKNKPVIVFEHGLGASEYYNARPEDVYDLLVKECGLNVSLLKAWLRNERSLTKEEFADHYYRHIDYYFMAHP
jgi:FkbM family methyltransferase